MGKGKPRQKPPKPEKGNTPRQRLFTKEYKVGDYVSVTRERHGWHDGALSGKIISLSAFSCTVRSDDGSEYLIEHPRDISKQI